MLKFTELEEKQHKEADSIGDAMHTVRGEAILFQAESLVSCVGKDTGTIYFITADEIVWRGDAKSIAKLARRAHIINQIERLRIELCE